MASTAKHVGQDGFPCIMAKAVFSLGHAHIIRRPDMADLADAAISGILQDIGHALAEMGAHDKGYHSLVLEFDAPRIACEHQFEALLWRMLQALHDRDSRQNGWDETVSCDPASPDFSFSLLGRAFYVIGLHPAASRKARRAAKPSMVLNPHAQFERLRASGQYKRLRDKIRARDEAWSGSINPMLEDFGASSEAIQYSGRQTDKDAWTCPFTPRNGKAKA